MDKIVLVNEQDENIGECEKLETHRKGYLHRAFSIFIFNSDGDCLLQKRANHKYHSPALWSNACCSHDVAGTNFNTYINQRLKEEIGITANLKKLFKTIYKLECGNNLTEHELNHVYIGFTDQKPILNLDEVSETRYIRKDMLLVELDKESEKFTGWFKVLYPMVLQNLCDSAIKSA